MDTYESEIKKVNSSAEDVYALVSDLSNIELFKNRIPTGKITDLTFDANSCHFGISPFGKIGVKIVDREQNKTVKYAADHSPVDFNMWIQLKEVSAQDTRLKLTVKADLNPLIKMMVSSQLQTMLNKLADALSKLPYSKLKKA